MAQGQSRELVILRHAKSDWDTAAATDFERPLAKRGRKNAPVMGRWMKKNKIIPDYIISSPAERAKQTLELVLDKMNVDPMQVHYDKFVYMASLQTLLDVLGQAPKAVHRVLLVGHNPGLDNLLEFLCEKDLNYTDSGKLLTTASLARIALPKDWRQLSKSCGQLLNLARPKEII